MTLPLSARLRRAFLDRATKAPTRWVAKPAYGMSVAVELAVVRLRDSRRPSISGDFDDVTAVIKTFERPRVLGRLLESLERVYPTLRILVVDDSQKPTELAHRNVEVLRMPYDSGLSAGRNAALAKIRTPLFLLLDDDFVITATCGLERVLATMRAHPSLDIVGGQVLTLPTFRRDVAPDNRDCFGRVASRPVSIGGLPVYDRVSNFFVGRTERVASVGWDPALKLLEHTDFFRRAHAKLLVAFDERFTCIHAMTPFDDDYMRHRGDIARYRAYLEMKWADVD